MFFLSLFLIFSYHCTKHIKYENKRAIIAESISNLVDNKLRNRNEIVTFLCFIIFTYYWITLIPLFVKYNQNDIYGSIMTIITPIILFAFFIHIIRNIFIGFREKRINRYSFSSLIFFVIIVYYWLNLQNILQIKTIEGNKIIEILSENAHWVVPFVISTIIAIVLFYIERKLKYKYPKRIIWRWERSLTIFDIFPEIIFAYIFLSIIVLSNLLSDIALISDFPETQRLLLVVVVIFSIMILILANFILKLFSNSFIDNMIKWNEFFECYNGESITSIGNYYQQLIKVKGKCRALSIDEKYRKKHEFFNQHFYIEIDGAHEDIDVISLEEKTPFKKYTPLVSESDHIILIGEMKSILDDESLFPSENRISEIIIAHHVELDQQETENSS
jgi:hypothetical protein